MTQRRDIFVAYTPHAYWPGMPHSMPRPFRSLVAFTATPIEAMRSVVADLGKKAADLNLAKARIGGVAVITVGDDPVALAYIHDGITRDEAAAALAQVKREEF